LSKNKLRSRKCPKCEYPHNRNLINTKRIKYTNYHERAIGWESHWKCFRCGFERIDKSGDPTGNKKVIYIKF